MKWHGISIKNNNDFVFTLPRIYIDNSWKSGTYYIYDGSSWKMVGGACTQMIKMIEDGGDEMESSGSTFLVREQWPGRNYLLDADGKYLFDMYHTVLHMK